MSLTRRRENVKYLTFMFQVILRVTQWWWIDVWRVFVPEFSILRKFWQTFPEQDSIAAD